jgi:potassium/chloride transporter 4/5/6
MQNYVRTLNGVLNLGKAIILFKGSPDYPTTNTDIRGRKCIDIWWIVYDGGLLLLLPYLLSKHSVWCNEEEPQNKKGKNRLRRRRKVEAKLRLFVVATSPKDDADKLRESVAEHLERMRIQAGVVVIVELANTNIAECMRDSNAVGSNRANKAPTRKQNGIGKPKALNRVASLVEDGISTHHMTLGEVFLDAPLPENVDADEYYRSGAMEAKQETASLCQEIAPLLNKMIRKYSVDANLVVTNLPFVPSEACPKQYFQCLNAIVKDIDNVMLVRGSGAEVITAIA